MDLLTMGKINYNVKEMVEGYRSLVWTERYQPWGDFELITEDVEYTRDLLPELGLCTLLDSNEVAMVDSHEITVGDDGVPTLTVKGRTVDSFPENRVWKNGPYGKQCKMAKKYTTKEAAAVWLWNAIANGTGNDRIKTALTFPAGNQIPNAVVTVSMPAGTDDGGTKARKVQNGVVYEQLITFLTSEKLGIRIIRPNGTDGRVVSVSGDGTYSSAMTNNIQDLRFDIYKGRDLTDRVVFSWRAGHLDNPNYVMSSESLKTGAYVVGDPRDHYYTDPEAIVGTNTGWNRRDAFVDGGSKEDDETADNFEESLEDLGLRAVRKEGKHINAVAAQISPFINYQYNKDYRLGDRVKVQGEYGSSNQYVTEFIRTQTEDGEVGYPTLSTRLS